MAFFPCIYFCDFNVFYFMGTSINFKQWKMDESQKIDYIMERADKRHTFYQILLKLFGICVRKKLRLILENPYSTSHFLHHNFPYEPTVIDKNRRLRGDFFKKPTQYFYLNCTPTEGFTHQEDKPHRTIKGLTGRSDKSGLCSEERSMISPDYARNFICDWVIGKAQPNITKQLELFN